MPGLLRPPPARGIRRTNPIPPINGPHGEGHTIFTPQAQALFLEHLSTRGNVRVACRVAGVSAQTVYRARRKSRALARLWDAALVSARTFAEDALHDRAIDGWEEVVWYRGEEVGRRRRFDARLLLAHLARLDRLAEKDGAEAGLGALDDAIEALARGEVLEERVPVEAGTSGLGAQPAEAPAVAGARGRAGDRGGGVSAQDPVPCVPSCRVSPPCPECGGACDDPWTELGPGDCQFLGNRLDRMDRARPEGARSPYALAGDVRGPGTVPLSAAAERIEALQLDAFECGLREWWTVTSEDELEARLAALEAEQGCVDEEYEEEEGDEPARAGASAG